MNANQVRLVLADDHELVRTTWQFLLTRIGGFDVVGTCSSGQEAIRAASTLLPDVVLMDINMEPVNGLEATSRILTICPGVKIIGVSTHNGPHYARSMLNNGARGYVNKDAEPNEMIEAILEVMKGNIYIGRDIRGQMEALS